MVKHIALASLLMGVLASPSFEQSAQTPQPCLHGPSEQPSQRARREQALRMAQQINREEHGGPALFSEPYKRYRTLEDLPNVPPTPTGFRLRLYTDTHTYTFSLKDTLDRCAYAIFSDQDMGIYEATPRTGVQLVPAETR